MAWAKNGTPDTLTSKGQAIEITDLTSYKFNVFLLHAISDGTNNTNPQWRVDDSGSTNNATRRQYNGGTDSTTTSDDQFINDPNGNPRDKFYIVYGCNISGEEKLFMGWGMEAQAGATNAPERGEHAGKEVTTAGQFSQVQADALAANGHDVGTNLSAIGTD